MFALCSVIAVTLVVGRDIKGMWPVKQLAPAYSKAYSFEDL